MAQESTKRENIAREEGGGGGRLVSYIELAYSITSMCDHLRQARDHNLSKTPKFSRIKRSE